ncbi:hypothetical protein [Chitinophaga filiformis]|uniref:Outer membrane protein beta-barrel domain-containing protein n=1 Tax=Chitinophaga filiformis TaxID=104663 RepID=A0A1G7WN45_CHIFI|nr:hypothetical protein [Chitinophaga filiformis]SDG73309.1 hypothetical protein SAMN04488121_10674 [Chitinophaga filiformis]
MKIGKSYRLPAIKLPATGAFCCIITLFTVRLCAQNRDDTDKEWEVVKYERYVKALKFSMDSLKLIYRHRWSVGFSFGGLYMPGATSTEKDYNTRVNMREKHSFYMLSFEYYLTDISRVGVEAGWQMLPMKIEPRAGGTYIDGGGGINIPVFVYLKRDIFGGVLNRTVMKPENRGSVNRPSFFAVAAAGLTFTNLVKIQAGRQELRTSQYRQVPFTSKLGIGMFQRIGGVVGVELIAAYQLSSNYSPSIGSVSAYSGFNLSTRLSLIGGGGFGKMKKRIGEMY